MLRPDLISNLIVGEGNVTRGGGAGSHRIASYSRSEYVSEAHLSFLEEMRRAAVQGSTMAAFMGVPGALLIRLVFGGARWL